MNQDVQKILKARKEELGLSVGEVHRRAVAGGAAAHKTTIHKWFTKPIKTLVFLGPVLEALHLQIVPKRRRKK